VQTKETKRNKVLEAIRERSDSQKSNIWVILLGHQLCAVHGQVIVVPSVPSHHWHWPLLAPETPASRLENSPTITIRVLKEQKRTLTLV